MTSNSLPQAKFEERPWPSQVPVWSESLIIIHLIYPAMELGSWADQLARSASSAGKRKYVGETCYPGWALALENNPGK